MTPIRYCLIPALLALGACSKSTSTGTATPVPQTESEIRRGNSTTVHTLGIPPGQLPRAGQCRVWVQGEPPGQQARSRECAGIAATAPAGSWIVYRPGSSRSVHVHVMDRSRAGLVLSVRHYNAEGAWVRDEEPGNHRDDASDDRGNGRGRRRN